MKSRGEASVKGSRSRRLGQGKSSRMEIFSREKPQTKPLLWTTWHHDEIVLSTLWSVDQQVWIWSSFEISKCQKGKRSWRPVFNTKRAFAATLAPEILTSKKYFCIFSKCSFPHKAFSASLFCCLPIDSHVAQLAAAAESLKNKTQHCDPFPASQRSDHQCNEEE